MDGRRRSSVKSHIVQIVMQERGAPRRHEIADHPPKVEATRSCRARQNSKKLLRDIKNFDEFSALAKHDHSRSS